jgi:hypothetical protein
MKNKTIKIVSFALVFILSTYFIRKEILPLTFSFIWVVSAYNLIFSVIKK